MIKSCYFFISKLTLLFLLGLISISSFAQKKVNTSNQYWLQYYNKTTFNNQWGLNTDMGLRTQQKLNNKTFQFFRTGISYTFNDAIKIASGISYHQSFKNDKITRKELRPYQEINFKNKWISIPLKQRVRIEERFLQPVNNLENSTTFNLRLRYAINYTLPLFKLSQNNDEQLLALQIGNEIFFNTNPDLDTFDQNRFTISPVLQFNKNLSFLVTWNNQLGSSSNQNTYDYDHVVWLKFKHAIDFRNNDG